MIDDDEGESTRVHHSDVRNVLMAHEPLSPHSSHNTQHTAYTVQSAHTKSTACGQVHTTHRCDLVIEEPNKYGAQLSVVVYGGGEGTGVMMAHVLCGVRQ